MMGRKERAFGPLPPLTLEDLVPSDHFYRHLERSLDLSCVRDRVHEVYANIGRPSIDPMVFFKRQLILFCEGLRSERRLMPVVADRRSLRSLPRRRPPRATARPLPPEPHPATARHRPLSALL